MAITNESKPSSSYTNMTRINIGEVWDSNLNTWNAETRTWNDMASLINNTTRVSSSITNTNKP